MAEAVATYVAEALFEWGWNEAIATAVAWTAGYVGTAYVASEAIGAIYGKPDLGSFASERTGQTQTYKSSVAPRNIIYGETVLSGPLLFVGSSDGFDPANNNNYIKNKFLHLVVGLASHECEAIREVWFDDESAGTINDATGYVSDGKYFHSAASDQTIRYHVPASFTSPYVELPETPVKIVSVTWDAPATNAEGGFTYQTQANVPYTLSGTKLSIPQPSVDTTLYVTYTRASANSYVRIKKHLGAADQLADADLVAEMGAVVGGGATTNGAPWTNEHRLRGIAYLYTRLEYISDLFSHTGPPRAIKAHVLGKKLYDPRDGQTRWSQNAALCALDFMLAPEGFGCTMDDIDMESVKAAANICDELVQTTRSVSEWRRFDGSLGYAATAAQYQKRYQCNGVLSLDKSPDENMRILLSSMGGTLVLAGGKLRLFAGAYTAPTAQPLTEKDLRGALRVHARTSRRDLFNRVRGTYTDGYKPGGASMGTWQATDFPLVKNDWYMQQDGNEEIFRDIELPMTIEPIQAQRLAKMTLERARQGITVEFPAKMTAFSLLCWDTVPVTIARLGWNNKVFRVVDWKFATEGGIDLVLREESPDAYNWNLGDETCFDSAPDTNLPVPGAVGTLGTITLSAGSSDLMRLSDGTIMSRILARWPATSDVLVRDAGHVELHYKPVAASDWIALPLLPGAETSTYIGPVTDRVTYHVRGRLVSFRGARGPWTYSGTLTVTGKSDPPGDVPWFFIDGDTLSWGEVGDIDLAGYRIRFHYGFNVSWSDAAPLHTGLLTQSPFTPVAKPQGQITLMIKAVDTTGNESRHAAVISNAFGDALVENVVETFDMQAAGYAANFID